MQAARTASRPTRSPFNQAPCRAQHRSAIVAAAGEHGVSPIPHVDANRRMLLSIVSMASMIGPMMVSPASQANIVQDLTRKTVRPEVDIQTAVVNLLDARTVLKEIAVLAATGADSQERFKARALWPGFAKYLRKVGEAAPVVISLVVGSENVEETLSEYYGGTAAGAGPADEVYTALGRILTISGRTIRIEAQTDPEIALAAEKSIASFVNKLPKDVVEDAQKFRQARAASAKAN